MYQQLKDLKTDIKETKLQVFCRKIFINIKE